MPHSALRFIPACAGNARRSPARRARQPVHPRVCGERAVRQHAVAVQSGSSPRVRGTLEDRPQHAQQRRFIPACAGNARGAPRGLLAKAVHPRVCGERLANVGDPVEHLRFIPACAGNALGRRVIGTLCAVHPRVCGERGFPATTSWSVGGSSPRVRGTHRISQFDRRARRFIPACAGNAWMSRAISDESAVHPRVCGERGTPVEIPIAASGSSPRVRGTLESISKFLVAWRFIPACAGNAVARSRPACPWAVHPACAGNALTVAAMAATPAVHPRVCGERHSDGENLRPTGGSSPRVRGTQKHSGPCINIRRFIPACAGNADAARAMRPIMAVHPRVCGERGDLIRIGNPVIGSSPRVRGTLTARRLSRLPKRFIPACAGNACRSVRGAATVPVHPRVCGERLDGGGTPRAFAGSSPRVRGTLSLLAMLALRDRFIPACAGNARRCAAPRRSSPVHPRVCGERPGRRSGFVAAIGSSPRVRGTRPQRIARCG